jgi:hypothetical protein
MPHTLSLTDGSTTVSLTTNNCILGHYVPGTPKRTGPGELDYGDVTESIEVTFTGASAAAAQSTINSVERLLLAAARRQNLGVGSRIFLQFQPIGDATQWRSEVRVGDVNLGDRSMVTFGQAKIEASIILTRVPHWEGSRTQIPLTNANGTNNTAGLTIYNHDDAQAGHDNFATIAASAIDGVLPSPLEIQLQNTSGANRGYTNFYLANNYFSTGLAHILEGENRVSGGTVGPGGSDFSNYSNGQYTRLTGTAFTCTWNISSAILQQIRGRYMRLLAKMDWLTGGDVWVKPVLKDYYGLVTLYAGPEVKLSLLTDSLLQDLGVIPLPVGGDSSWAQLRLSLEFRAGSSQTLDIDYVQLTPADPLCWRDIAQRGMEVQNNDYVVDDGIEGLTYLIEGGANHPIYAPIGTPLHVFPGVAQRLYVLCDGVGTSPIWTMKIKAWYRPRRITI